MTDDLNAKIIETHHNVKWICRTLEAMKETDADFEAHPRDPGGWQAEKAGVGLGNGGIIAGLSGVAGALAARVVQWLGVGRD